MLGVIFKLLEEYVYYKKADQAWMHFTTMVS